MRTQYGGIDFKVIDAMGMDLLMMSTRQADHPIPTFTFTTDQDLEGEAYADEEDLRVLEDGDVIVQLLPLEDDLIRNEVESFRQERRGSPMRPTRQCLSQRATHDVNAGLLHTRACGKVDPLPGTMVRRGIEREVLRRPH